MSGRSAFVAEPVLFSEVADLVFGEIKPRAGSAKAQEAALPDLHGGVSVEFGVVEADMYARSERFIKFAHTVGSEYNDAGEVFKDSEKDCRMVSKRRSE